MQHNIFAVCDLEAEYAVNFLDYANQRNIPFKVQAFTSIEKLKNYARDHPIEILLISNRAMCPEIQELDIGKIIILSEGVMASEYPGYDKVYKYQSQAEVIREVLAYYGKEAYLPVAEAIPAKKKVAVTAIYSPISRCGKSSLAWSYAQILAETQKVLLLNLERHSGFPQMTGRSTLHGLSDLLYYLYQDNSQLGIKLSGLVETMNHVDYIPPVSAPTDLDPVTYKQWEILMNYLIYQSAYEAIILDMGQGLQDFAEIFSWCDRILMPVLEDEISRCKVEEFMNFLRRDDYAACIGRLQPLNLPAGQKLTDLRDFPSVLAYNELGSYVRRLCEKGEL